MVSQLRRLVTTVYAFNSIVTFATGTALSACDSSSKDLYVVDAAATSTQFPAGYVSCINATGSDARLCEICSCREKKVGSVAGVPVAGVVCVGSEDATKCTSPDRDFCDYNDGTTTLRDGSSLNQDVSAGNVPSTSFNVGHSNASTISAGSNSTSSPDIASNLTAESVVDHTQLIADASSSSNVESSIGTESSSLDTSLALDINVNASIASSSDDTSSSLNASNHVNTSSTDSTSNASPSFEFKPKMIRAADIQDKTISDAVGAVMPSRTDTASSANPLITRPQDSGSTLNTNNGSPSRSSWSGGRLLTVLSAMCGIGVAAIVVFLAVRRGESKKDKELTTPMDNYPDDNSSSVTPTTHGKGGARYCAGGDCTMDSFGNTPQASIVVIGDAFLTPPSNASKSQYRPYPDAKKYRSDDNYSRTDSTRAGKCAVARGSRSSSYASQQQLFASNGPSVSDLQSPTSYLIFDFSNTRESFSSGMNSQFESIPDDELGESFATSRMASEAYSDSSRNSSDHRVSLEPEEEATPSSPSSLENGQYAARYMVDREDMHESDTMTTDSSRIAISFDMDSM